MGAAGGIVGGLATAGVAAISLGARFASTGFEVARTSAALGISARDLQRLRGAAKLAGVEVGAIDKAVASLGDTLQNARFFRDRTARIALERMGIGVPLKNGQVDQMAALEGIARVMQRISDPHVRDVVADVLHIPRESIPLLMQGADAMKRLGDESERQGNVAGPKALQWSIDFTNSLNRMQGAINGAANSLGAKLVPSLSQGLDYLTQMTEQSDKDRLGTALTGMNDMRLGGWRALKWLGSVALHGNIPTTAAQRHVSGDITDPAPAATRTTDGGLVDGRFVDPAVQAARDRDALRIVQQERDQATSDADRAALTRELAARNAGAATNTLSPMTGAAAAPRQVIEINVSRLPPDARVSASVKGGAADGSTPTRISYSLARDEMP
jgi:hypothetical protein